MKSLTAFVLTVVLTSSLLTGCGCTNRNMENTSAPTVLPTNEEIWNTTQTVPRDTTEPKATAAATDATMNTTVETTDTTLTTADTESTVEGRIRRMMPGNR